MFLYTEGLGSISRFKCSEAVKACVMFRAGLYSIYPGSTLWSCCLLNYLHQSCKGPSQKYLEANEVKYFSGGGGGGGRRVHGHYFTFSKKNGFMLVFTIIE